MLRKAISLFVLLSALTSWASVGLAKTSLQGSATITRTRPVATSARGTAWSPRESSMLQADALVRAYKLDAAERLYRQALAQNSKNAAAWNGLGKIAAARAQSSDRVIRSQAGQLYADAVQYFLSALRYQPGYVEAHLNLARVYLARQQYFLAQDSIERALSLAPNSSSALSVKAEWHMAQGQFAEALPVLQKAAKFRPNDAHINALLAQTYMNLGDWDTAYRTVQSALAQNPTSFRNYLTLGQLQEQRGNQAAAEVAYLKAVALKPEMAEVRTKVADFYEKRGDFRTAAEHLKSLADSDDVAWPVVERVGKLSVKSGQPDVAVHYYRKWLNDHPDDHTAQAAMSYAKRELARQKYRNDDLISQGEAKRYAEQSIQYNPENYEARLIAAKLDREIGVKPEKIAPHMVDIALNQADYRSSQAFDRAVLLLSRYQFGEAKKAFREARLADVSPRGQMVYGELLLAKGLPSLAEEAFQQVLGMLPGNTSAQLGMSKAREAREKSGDLTVEARKSAPAIATRKAQEALKLNVENVEAYRILAQQAEAEKKYSDAADYYYAYRELCMDPAEVKRITGKIESLKRKIGKQ